MSLSENSKVEAEGKSNIEEELPDKYFEPLQSACLTKHSKLTEIALDAIHHLLGTSIYLSILLYSLFHLVLVCHIMLVYFTLFKTIQICIHSFLVAHLITFMFRCLLACLLVSTYTEHGYLHGDKKVPSKPTSPTATTTPTPSEEESKTTSPAASPAAASRTLMDVIVETVAKCSEEYDDVVHVQVIKLLLMTLTSKNCEVHEASLLLAVRSCFHIHLISKNPANKTTAKAALTQIMSVVFNRMEAKDVELMISSDIHTPLDKMNLAVSPLVASAQGLTINTKTDPDPDPETDKETSGVEEKVEDNEKEKSEQKESTSEEEEGGEVTVVTKPVVKNKTAEIFPSVFHKDAFLIFRALCKLSMKGLQDETGGSPSDPIALQNK